MGATGISYEGIAAELLPIAHPATRVVVPREADIDQYAEFLFPGGIPNAWMIATWQHTNEALDRNRFPAEWTAREGEPRSLLYRAAGWLNRFAIKGVRPIDADTDGSQLRLRFGLLPSSWLVRRGHRLRVAVAGHDTDTFARIPDAEAPIIAVQRNRRYPSQIALPIVRT